MDTQKEDISGSLFSYEVIHRNSRTCPFELRAWIRRNRIGASDGKIPILIISLSDETAGDNLTVLRRYDFEVLLKKICRCNPTVIEERFEA